MPGNLKGQYSKSYSLFSEDKEKISKAIPSLKSDFEWGKFRNAKAYVMISYTIFSIFWLI